MRAESTLGGQSARSGAKPQCQFTTFKQQQQHSPQGDATQQRHQIAHQLVVTATKIAPLDLYRQHPSELKFNGSHLDDDDSMARAKASAPTPVEPFKFAGHFGAVMSVLTFSLGMFCIKLLPVETSIKEAAKACTFRGLFMTLISFVGVLQQRASFKVGEDEFWITFIRAVSSGIANLCCFVAVQFIGLGERSAVSYFYVVWTALLGYTILKEPLKASLLLVIPVSFLGVILLAKPSLIVDSEHEVPLRLSLDLAKVLRNISGPEAEHEVVSNRTKSPLDLKDVQMERRLIGFSTSLVASFAAAVVVIALKLRKRMPIVTCAFYQSLSVVLIGISFQLVVGFGNLPVDPIEWALHFLIGLLSWLSQYLRQWSLQFIPATMLSIIMSLDIVLGFLLGVVLLCEPLLWTSLVGSFLIVFMALILMSDQYLINKTKQILCRR